MKGSRARHASWNRLWTLAMNNAESIAASGDAAAPDLIDTPDVLDEAATSAPGVRSIGR